MGNSLHSRSLAEICVNNIKIEIHQNPTSKYFSYWFRKIDDILSCFRGTTKQLKRFLHFINNLLPSIITLHSISPKNDIIYLKSCIIHVFIQSSNFPIPYKHLLVFPSCVVNGGAPSSFRSSIKSVWILFLVFVSGSSEVSIRIFKHNICIPTPEMWENSLSIIQNIHQVPNE